MHIYIDSAGWLGRGCVGCKLKYRGYAPMHYKEGGELACFQMVSPARDFASSERQFASCGRVWHARGR